MADRKNEENLIHRGLGRVEFFDFSEERMDCFQDTLDAMAGEGRQRFSFHSPIVRPLWFPWSGVSCFFLSENANERELSFNLLGQTLELAKRWRADYVVSHLTYGPSDTKDEAVAARLAVDACARIAEMSRRSEIPVDLEFAAYSDSFHRPDEFASVVAAHPELGICVDIGHAFIGAKNRRRDFADDIASLAGNARSCHLWNTTGANHTKANHHTPLGPSQRPEDGWIDTERVMALLIGGNPEINVVFEYPVAELSPEIQQGYDWISAMIDKYAAK